MKAVKPLAIIYRIYPKNPRHPQKPPSVTNNDPYYPYNPELLEHDEASTQDLGED